MLIVSAIILIQSGPKADIDIFTMLEDATSLLLLKEKLFQMHEHFSLFCIGACK